MATRTIKRGSTSQIITVILRDSTGALKTGIAYGSVTYSYSREGDSARSYATCTSGTLDTFGSGTWVEVDATNQPGKYQFGVPNGAIATGAVKASITFKGTGFLDQVEHIILTAYDPQSDTDLGLSELNAAYDYATTVEGLLSDPDFGWSALFSKFAGITVLANWLRGLFRKDAMNATAKSEVNTGGGTFNEATDSNEAIRDTEPLGTAMRGTDNAALASAWTSARAGYLDKLNVTGNVASQADVLAINQSASRRIVLMTVAQFERPESGDTYYQIEGRLYTADGAPVNADSAPTLAATGLVSGNLSSNVGSPANPSTGVYRWDYLVEADATLEQIRFDFSAVVSSETLTISAYSQVCDFVAATFTTADRANIEAALADTNEIQTDWHNGGRLDLIIDAINAKAANLPSNPADQSAVEAAIASAVSSLATATSVAAIKTIVDKFDGMIVVDGLVYQFTANALELGPSGTGSAPTVQEIVDGVLDELLEDHEVAGSVGEALATAGAGGIPPTTQEQIDAIEAGIAALQGATSITLASPIGSGGNISILYGYDYKNANALAVTWVNAEGSWPNLTGAAIDVVRLDDRTSLGGTKTVVTPSGVNQTIRWEIDDTTFAAATTMPIRYVVQATLSGGNKVALTEGNLTVR